MAAPSPSAISDLAANLARKGVITNAQRVAAESKAVDSAFSYNFVRAAQMEGQDRHARMWELLPVRDGDVATGSSAQQAGAASESPGGGWAGLGGFLLLVAAGLGIYAAAMDTTAYGSNVLNIGLIANRIVMAVAAGACMVGGLVCLGAGAVLRRLPK